MSSLSPIHASMSSTPRELGDSVFAPRIQETWRIRRPRTSIGSLVARKQFVELVDDLDQTVIDDGGTYSFSLNGKAYEIDLTSDNFAKLREALSPFITAGRRVGRGSKTSVQRAVTKDDTSVVRAWAQQNGYTVSDRGRIPAEVIAAYRAS